MAKAKAEEWIIGIGGTETDGVRMHKFIGTEQQVKKHLVELVKNDRENDEESFDDGTLLIKDVDCRENGNAFYSFGNYTTYHIDYEARRHSCMNVVYPGGKKEKILITCYGDTETWTDREKAKAFYLEAIASSEGSEQSRYVNIYTQLCEGLTKCTDGE